MAASETRKTEESKERKLSDIEGLDTAYILENTERLDLIGRKVRLSDGREGIIVHVEYEPPERVALVKTYPETPSPLTRVGVDRFSPPHLPYIVDLILEPGDLAEDTGEASQEGGGTGGQG